MSLSQTLESVTRSPSKANVHNSSMHSVTMQSRGVRSADDAMRHNPFRMPTDEEVFILRDEERKKKKQEREKQRDLHVWEKSTWSSRLATSNLHMEDGFDDREGDVATSRSAGFLPAISSKSGTDRPKDKENMSEFISKKREMFLVQMSLDNKQQEITKLEQKAAARLSKLREDQALLEENAHRFEQFLKQNQNQAAEATKRAEDETKAKAEKVADIKRLNAQILAIKTDIAKFSDQLEECDKYKKFLEALTPQDWKDEQAKLKAQRKAMRPLQSDDASDDIDLELDSPMYFQRPEQLIEIFAALEQSNLFLIQNCQETEESLDELASDYEATRKRMDAETNSLKAQIADLNRQIQGEEQKARILMERSVQSTGAESQEELLKELTTKVTDVYEKAGFDNEASISILQMLTNIEAKLEELLSQIVTMPKGYVEAAEKAKEKDRRSRVREERLEQQKRNQENRIKKALDRAQEPSTKKTGKPLMSRSVPVESQRKKQEQEAEQQEQQEREDYLEFFC